MGALIFAVNFLFSAYYVLLAARAVLPWKIVWLHRLTDPVLNPIRAGLPPQKIGLDVSPFVAIILLWLAQKTIVFFLAVPAGRQGG